MNKLDNQFKKAVEHIRMNDAEHSHLKSKLTDLISNKSLDPIASNLPVRSYFSDTFIAFRRIGVASALLVVLVFAGGLSALADQSLPGNILYPVKTGVLEKLRDTFAIGAENQARQEIKKIARRVDEAARLQAQGKLGVEEQTLLESKISQHEEAALSLADTLRSQDKAALALNIEADVTIHAQSKKVALNTQSNDSIQSSALSIAMMDTPFEIPPENNLFSPSIEENSRSLRIAEGVSSNEVSALDDTETSLSSLSATLEEVGDIPNDLVSSTVSGGVDIDEDKEYKLAAQKQKDSYEKVRAEIEIMTALAPRLTPTFKEKYEDEIETPLNSVRELVRQGDEAFKNEEYRLAFDRYTEAHAETQLIVTKIKTGSWAAGEVNAGTESTSTSSVLELPSVPAPTSSSLPGIGM